MATDKSRYDLLRLKIPSDQLGREAVLAANPRLHPAYAGRESNLSDEDLNGAIYVAMRANETALIAKTLDLALGRPDPYPQNSLADLRAALTDDYQFFAISPGRKHAEETLRGLEKAAQAQAEASLGRRAP